jgi:hypothetical protein
MLAAQPKWGRNMALTEEAELLRTQDAALIHLNVKLTGNLCLAWEKLLRRLGTTNASEVLKESIRLRCLLALLQSSGKKVEVPIPRLDDQGKQTYELKDVVSYLGLHDTVVEESSTTLAGESGDVELAPVVKGNQSSRAQGQRKSGQSGS